MDVDTPDKPAPLPQGFDTLYVDEDHDADDATSIDGDDDDCVDYYPATTRDARRAALRSALRDALPQAWPASAYNSDDEASDGGPDIDDFTAAELLALGMDERGGDGDDCGQAPVDEIGVDA